MGGRQGRRVGADAAATLAARHHVLAVLVDLAAALAVHPVVRLLAVHVTAVLPLGAAAVLLLLGLLLDEGIAATFAGLKAFDLDLASGLPVLAVMMLLVTALHGSHFLLD